MAPLYFLALLLLPVLVLFTLFFILFFTVRPRPVRIPLKGRHVLVSGGSSGIGFAIAHRAAAEGARVSILARDLIRLEESRDAIQASTGIEPVILVADVRDAAAVARALDETDPVDVLVCNQGVFVPQELERQSIEEVRFTMDVNVMGTFHLIKAALPGMKKRARETGLPASISLVSSQAGQVGVYGYSAYSASKFALRGLSEALQHEVIMDNIHISLIFPPDTDTPGFAEEVKRRPEVTKIIASASGGMKAADVARRALDGIKAGKFVVPCNFEGTMLAIATAGLSPQPSCAAAFAEVAFAGMMRFVGLLYQWNWFSSIEKWQAKMKNT